jgi:hypothetical protein
MQGLGADTSQCGVVDCACPSVKGSVGSGLSALDLHHSSSKSLPARCPLTSGQSRWRFSLTGGTDTPGAASRHRTDLYVISTRTSISCVVGQLRPQPYERPPGQKWCIRRQDEGNAAAKRSRYRVHRVPGQPAWGGAATSPPRPADLRLLSVSPDGRGFAATERRKHSAGAGREDGVGHGG